MLPVFSKTSVCQYKSLTNTVRTDVQFIQLEAFHQSADDQRAGRKDARSFHINVIAPRNLFRREFTQELLTTKQVSMRERRLRLRHVKSTARQLQKCISAAPGR